MNADRQKTQTFRLRSVFLDNQIHLIYESESYLLCLQCMGLTRNYRIKKMFYIFLCYIYLIYIDQMVIFIRNEIKFSIEHNIYLQLKLYKFAKVWYALLVFKGKHIVKCV